MMNANEIKNSTIAKLDRNEMSALRLFDAGIVPYRGELKSRKQGWKTVKVDDIQTNFVGEKITLEFIRMVSVDDRPAYAMRLKDNATEEYETNVFPLLGIEFFKN